jgi:hypothetical protein
MLKTQLFQKLKKGRTLKNKIKSKVSIISKNGIPINKSNAIKLSKES